MHMDNKKTFIVTLEIESSDEESVWNMISKMVSDDRTLYFKIQEEQKEQ